MESPGIGERAVPRETRPVGYHSFEKLEVWVRACRLAVDVYERLRGSREFALRDQMWRSAISIPSNIAEGAERGGRDFIRFLRIARGSAAELRTQCYIAASIGVLPPEQSRRLVGELKELSKMLTALARSLDHDLSQRHPRPRPPPTPLESSEN